MQVERTGDIYVRYDDQIDRMLDGIERESTISAANNYRVMDNHLLHCDRIIAQQAAQVNVSETLWDKVFATFPFFQKKNGEES